ncbi:hypothetical protein Mapa_015162 [Marchantia paleacea]|nr:hypothetical protein Mapa_015162 [Marchantia paleacea]
MSSSWTWWRLWTVPVCATLIVISVLRVTDFGRGAGGGGAGVRVDVHHHFCPPFYWEYLAEHRSGDGGLNYTHFDEKSSLRMMDRMGIAKSVLSLATPGVALPNVDQQTWRHMARAVNQYGAQVVKDHAGRFGLFASLTLPDVQGAVDEATYALDVLHADGFIVGANQILGQDSNEPLYELLNDRGSVVLIHPDLLPGSTDSSHSFEGLDVYNEMADFLLDTVHALNFMMITRVPQRFPNIKWITAHGGGFWPYSSSRFAYTIGPYLGMSPEKLTQIVSSFFYFDTAGLAGSVSIQALTDFVQPGHVLFGSDWPFVGIELLQTCISTWDSYHFSSNTRRSIYSAAAESLLSNKTYYSTKGVGSPPSDQPSLLLSH